MTQDMPHDGSATGNPFSTRFTRPSNFDFLFPPGVNADQLVAELRTSAWWGQITGRHGSGKSTLLHTLVPALKRAGRSIVFFTLRRSERHLSVDRAQMQTWNDSTQVIVDGYEQLGWLQRTWLKRTCRARRAGLLVTTHSDVGLPPVWQTETSNALAWRITMRLLADSCRGRISEADVKTAFADNQGDLRETLMALYDLFEQRRMH